MISFSLFKFSRTISNRSFIDVGVCVDDASIDVVVDFKDSKYGVDLLIVVVGVVIIVVDAVNVVVIFIFNKSTYGVNPVVIAVGVLVVVVVVVSLVDVNDGSSAVVVVKDSIYGVNLVPDIDVDDYIIFLFFTSEADEE